MRGDALSDFDVMYERLENWGRWGRQDSDRPDPEAGTAQIYEMGRADRQGDQEHADGSVDAEDEPPARIDSRDADNMDGYIRQLGRYHYQSVRRYFYLRWSMPRPDEAIRMLCDMEQANQAVNQRMRRA